MDTRPIVVDFDDFYNVNNGLDLLFRIKSEVKGFKCTLFTVLGRCSLGFIKTIHNIDWIEMACHGRIHNHKECQYWDLEEIKYYISHYDNIYSDYIQKIFKPPYWLGNDIIYKELDKNGFIIAENLVNGKKRPDCKYVYTLQDKRYKYIHGHIQDGCGNGLKEQFTYYCSLKGEFKFISELRSEL